MTERKTYNLFVDGNSIPSLSGERYEIINPANGLVIASVSKAGTDDAELTIKSARSAFDEGPWARYTGRQRAKVLMRIASLIETHVDELAYLETINSGKPINDATEQVLKSSACFEYYAGLADKLWGATIPIEENLFAYTLREPIGVCLGITPWNSPLILASYKTAPALAVGNTVILKPASKTPLTSIRLAEICMEAGIPPGVVNVLPGPGATIGMSLAAHPGVDKISFTGDNKSGSAVMAAAAGTIKRVTLELGGKSPSLIFPDAEMDQAVPSSVRAIYSHAGQRCTARSRLLVHETIYEQFVERFVGQTKAIHVGDPLNVQTEMGPVISLDQKKKILAYIEEGIRSGAQLLYGGEPGDSLLQDGYYLLPAVFTNVENESSISQKEIFGPVVCILKFSDESEAVHLANDTIYGLAASVWTNDLGRAHRMVKALRAGVISVNSVPVTYIEAPFGGYKQSGIGRELGLEGLLQFSETKSVFLRI